MYFSTNIHPEFFKHAAHSPLFSLQNAVYFILHTGCAKILMPTSSPKTLMDKRAD
jgi:hypothetical protein